MDDVKKVLEGLVSVAVPDAAVRAFEEAFHAAPDSYPTVKARNDALRGVLAATIAQCEVSVAPQDLYEAIGLPGGEAQLLRLFYIYRDMRRLLDVLTVEYGQEPEIKGGSNVVDATIALLHRLTDTEELEKRAAPISIPLFLKETRTKWDA